MTDTPTINAESELVARLREIQARADSATPGPWDALGGTNVRAIKDDLACPIFESLAPIDWHKKKNVTHTVLCRAYADETNNAKFIAHAREDIPFLLATIERLASAHETLFNAIKHGDEVHRDWLREAIANHFSGKPVPPPRAANPSAREAGRREGIEMAEHAAQNAKHGLENPSDEYDEGYDDGLTDAVLAIRALSAAPSPEKGERITSGEVDMMGALRTALAASPPPAKAEDGIREAFRKELIARHCTPSGNDDCVNAPMEAVLRALRAALAKEGTPS